MIHRMPVSALTDSETGNVDLSLCNRLPLQKVIFRIAASLGSSPARLIDLVAIAFGIGAAIFVAGDHYRLSSVDGAVVFAFLVGMFSVNFICRKVASWCFLAQPTGEPS
jgi:hypothetical protein